MSSLHVEVDMMSLVGVASLYDGEAAITACDDIGVVRSTGRKDAVCLYG